jgi:ATP-dependent exoDNAse (exonuclease V) beta subunit
MIQGFMACLQAHFQPTSLHWEVPITAGNHKGSVIGGTVDLLVETADGFWIVDHKSDEPQDIAETFHHYLPQLQCYAQALSEGFGYDVRGVAIHWACLGIISAANG